LLLTDEQGRVAQNCLRECQKSSKPQESIGFLTFQKCSMFYGFLFSSDADVTNNFGTSHIHFVLFGSNTRVTEAQDNAVLTCMSIFLLEDLSCRHQMKSSKTSKTFSPLANNRMWVR
jgi:hypothetical protein